MKKLLVFASGDKEGGGSGFQKLVENTMNGVLQRTEIVGVVSNQPWGGVWKRAVKFGIPFFHFPGPYTIESYQGYVRNLRADFFALSGWLKLVKGLPSNRTINIHPGPLPQFGGPGMYGHHVHEAVLAAFRCGEITHSAVSMHFVTDQYDQGPVFFRCGVEILEDDTAESLAARVNRCEHNFQSYFTNKVITGEICWDGEHPESLQGAVDWPRAPIRL